MKKIHWASLCYMAKASRSPRARTLGNAIRALRESKSLPAREVARRISTYAPFIGRVESGTKLLTVDEASVLLGALEASPEQRNRILDLVRDLDRPNWHLSGANLPDQLETLIMYEREATQITEVSLMLIPGLLQTGDYARAVIHSGREGGDDTLVYTRLGRQEILNKPSGPRFVGILDEGAVRREVGGPDVMAHQLGHLTKLMREGTIDIRVLPVSLGVHAAMSGSFWIGEFADATPIVHLEHLAHGSFIDEPSDVEPFLTARSNLLAAALDSAESADLIAAAAERHARDEAR
ncbi:DNA binding protein with helix-turn-helix domain [Actinoalloteichus sp. GBA129-24]|uniref:DNA binding protein with helix-turn-helix domain n=3 Tax=Actinoalloteichus TaxID=65496 RepID=A0AAC9LEV4_9PSEU|nr:DNA binding protein with helix-turn-helix domain [Actinoalloteichus fjordicus]APU21642.1 DNA binding protein with helix-turn-helix domain [Actinoalloteichus sp. GBA129-24]